MKSGIDKNYKFNFARHLIMVKSSRYLKILWKELEAKLNKP